MVRLKGGDPAVFARGAQEAAALAAANVPFEVVPGITAALAAGSHAGVFVTDREQASAVAIVTGQERPGKADDSLDFDALARFPGTLVFYMGVTTVEHWTGSLIAAGKPPETPAAIIRRVSFPDQQTIRCTLGEVAGRLSPRGKLPPPVIVIVGEVASAGEDLNWFERRPLCGASVMVTRPAGQAPALAEQLKALGAEVLVQPAIEIGDPPDWAPVDGALARLAEFDWLVFSSRSGVQYLLRRLLATGGDLRALAGIRLAAIGPGTAEALAEHHLRAELVPPEYRAEALAGALKNKAAGKRFLLARASRGREVLAEELSRAGGAVEQVVVYESRDVTAPRPEIAARLAAGEIDWITVTSSAIARSLVAMFGDDLRRCRLVSISPITSATLRQLGWEPSAEAAEYTMPGLTAALLAALR